MLVEHLDITKRETKTTSPDGTIVTMTSAVQTSAMVEPPGGGYEMNNGSVTGSAASSVTGESGSTSGVPDILSLAVLLPNGDSKFISVESGKQMMDLTVQLAAANKLSPASHTIQVVSESENSDRPIDYQPSQTLASIYAHNGPIALCLVHKRPDFQIEKMSRENSRMANQPFEKTQRLTVNLPQNQKTVLRVSPKSSMADILHLVCQEKNLDPASHALRHPSQPELDLPDNLTLKEHGTAEVSLVMIHGGGESKSSRASRSSVTTRSSVTVPAQTRDVHLRVDSQHHSDATMSNKQHEEQPSVYYMPGMDNKKKKGFLSKIFSRKKGDSFKIPEATRQSAPPPSRHLSSSMGALNNTSSLSTPAPQQQGSSDHRYSQPPPQRATIAGPPAKPPRKKRPAPPPPTAVKPAQPQTSEPNINGSPAEDGIMIQTQKPNVTHSRGSSHSSGFAEGDVSPLGSPASSSKEHVAGRSASDDGLGGSSDGLSVPPGLAAMHKDSLLTSSGSESGSLPRTTKKKRRAPLPPGAKAKLEAKDTDNQAQPTVVVETKQEDSQGGSTLDSSPNTLNQSQNDLANSDSQSEISRSRPCLFIAPPPPDTPPPTDNSDHPLAMPGDSKEQTNSATLSDSSTQVHVSARDSLSSDCGYTRSRSSSASSATSSCSPECMDALAQSTDGRSSPNRHALTDPDPGQKSDLAVFVDQMGELTENVYQESTEVNNAPPSEEDQQVVQEVVKVEVDDNKHDVNHNVESGNSQDEPIDSENRVSGVTIKRKEDNSAVSIIRIGNPDSEFQDTLQAFDNVENDTDEGSALQSNTSVSEISLDGQNLEQEKGNFVSLIQVGDELEEENTSTSNTATHEVLVEEATSEVSPVRDEESVHKDDALLAMEEITFDQSEVVYVSPQNNEEESVIAKELSDQEEKDDNTEVVFFSEDGQSWGPTEPSEQPKTLSDTSVGLSNTAGVADEPSPTEREDHTGVPEKGSEDPDLYTVTVTREYVISHKPDESDYTPLPESARKSTDNEEAPRIKSLREAYRRSASGPQSSSRDDEDVWSPGVNAHTLPDQTETFASESSVVNISDTSNVTEPDVFVEPEEDVSLVVTQEKSAVVQTQQQQQRKNISVDAESPKRKKTSHREFTFLGPRPYGFRAKSEPSVKDVRAALQLHQASNEGSGEQSTGQTDNARSPRAFSFQRQQHRTLGLSKSDSTESPEHGTYFQQHGVVKTTRSTENVAQSKDKAKKSLQSQYADLQLQFARWQQQLKDNQSLLDTKPIFETKDTVTVFAGRPTKSVESMNKPTTATISQTEAKEERKPASRAPKSILKTSAKPERHPQRVDAKPVSAQPAPTTQKSAPVTLTAKPPISPVSKVSAESRDADPVFLDQTQDADHAVSKDLVTARSRLRSKTKEDKMCIRFNADGTKSRVYKSSVTDITAPAVGSPQIGRRSYYSKDSQRHHPSHQQAVRTVSASPPPAPPPPSKVVPVVSDNNNVPKSALRQTKGQSRVETGPSLDPREELMLAIRRAGGRGALRPVTVKEIHWSKLPT